MEKVAQGIIKYRYHILDGLKEAPLGINMLFTGENRGKLCVTLFITLFYTSLAVFGRVVKVSH